MTPRLVSPDLIMNREEMEATLSRMSREEESASIRLRAMEQLAKIQGLHLERHQIESRVEVTDTRKELREMLERPELVSSVLALTSQLTRGVPEVETDVRADA
jgi:hypothetical protein